MPELPEVETIVRDLKPVLVGQRFRSIVSSISNVSGLERVAALAENKVADVRRRGKFINIFLENGAVITVHLRMSGRLLYQGLDDAALRFERSRIDFDKSSLRFCDVRKFGRIWVSDLDSYERESGIWKLGVEPLDDDFDLPTFKIMLRGRKGLLKKWLLDQTLIAGIGNIYADEACFYAGVRPDREVSELREVELEALFEGILKALNQGVRNRGTSISDFEDAYGKTGRNQELINVYGRGGLDCSNCGRVLKKIKLVGRGTVFCEKCQD